MNDSPGEATLRAIKAGGFRLKPTKTVDKSKPIIKADGETFQPVLNTKRYVDPYTNDGEQRQTATPSAQSHNGNSHPPAPPPPPPPMNANNPRPVPPPPLPPMMMMPKSHSAITISNNNSPAATMKPASTPPVDRHALMGDIKRGIKLRKSVVVDKSRPILAGEFDDQLPPLGSVVENYGADSDTSSLSSQDMAQALLAEMRAVQQQYATLNRENIVDVSQPRRRPVVMYATRRTPPRDMVKCTLDSPPSPPPALDRSVRDLATAMFGAPHTKSTPDLHQNATNGGVYRTLPTKPKAKATQQVSNATLTLQRATPAATFNGTPLQVYTKSTESLDSGAHSFSPAPMQASPSKLQLVDRAPISTAYARTARAQRSSTPCSPTATSSAEVSYIVGAVERAKHSLASSAASATSSSASSEQSGTNSPPNVGAPPALASRTALADDFMQRFDMNRPFRPAFAPSAVAMSTAGMDTGVGSIRSTFEHAGTAPPSSTPSNGVRTLPRRLPSGNYLLNTSFTTTPAPISGGARGVSVDRLDPHRFLPAVSNARRQFENDATTKTSPTIKVSANVKSPPPKMVLQPSPFAANTDSVDASANARQAWLKAVNEKSASEKKGAGQNFNTHRKSPLKVDFETTTTTTTRTLRISPDKLPMSEAARDILSQCASIDIEQLRGQFVFDIDLDTDHVVQLNARVLK